MNSLQCNYPFTFPSLTMNMKSSLIKYTIIFTICFLFCAVAHFGNDIFILLENSQPSYLVHNTKKVIIVNNAKRLPSNGDNFKTYSRLLSTLGRTHVHEKLREVILETYGKLKYTNPNVIWVYGESGWKNGGVFWPHRTHRKGLSVDFIVPVKEIKRKRSVILPLSIFNLYGYAIRFDTKGTYENYIIDFEGIIAHLQVLQKTSKDKNIRIKRVILDPPLLALMRKSPKYHLIKDINFMENQAWFAHDSHYHVDFDILK